MDWRDRAAIKDIWEEGWAFGSHGSPISFDEWYAEKFSKQIAKDARKIAKNTEQANQPDSGK